MYKMNLEEKLRIAEYLDEMGVDVMEAGLVRLRFVLALDHNDFVVFAAALEKDIDASKEKWKAKRPGSPNISQRLSEQLCVHKGPWI